MDPKGAASKCRKESSLLIQINITRGIYKYIYVTPGFPFELQLLQEEAGEVRNPVAGSQKH